MRRTRLRSSWHGINGSNDAIRHLLPSSVILQVLSRRYFIARAMGRPRILSRGTHRENDSRLIRGLSFRVSLPGRLPEISHYSAASHQRGPDISRCTACLRPVREQSGERERDDEKERKNRDANRAFTTFYLPPFSPRPLPPHMRPLWSIGGCLITHSGF